MIFIISPIGYNLPSEYTKLAEECSRNEKDDKIWICKPVGQSQGRGIFLFRVRLLFKVQNKMHANRMNQITYVFF